MSTQKDFFILKKLLHVLIKKGKKAKALTIFLKLLKNLRINNTMSMSGIDVIYAALSNAKPLLHVKKVRKSSKVFYLPKIINTEQKLSLAIHWFLKSVNTRKEKNLSERLEKEFLDCFLGKGSTMAKKQALYDSILVNRPFLNLLIYK